MASMDTTAPSPPPPTAEFRHKVYMDENGVETTLLERRKVRMRRIASDASSDPSPTSSLLPAEDRLVPPAREQEDTKHHDQSRQCVYQ